MNDIKIIEADRQVNYTNYLIYSNKELYFFKVDSLNRIIVESNNFFAVGFKNQFKMFKLIQEVIDL